MLDRVLEVLLLHGNSFLIDVISVAHKGEKYKPKNQKDNVLKERH
jgi:hypothetical protein